MIVHGYTPRTRSLNAPSLLNRTKGATIAERLVKLRAQLKTVDNLLECTKDAGTRSHLNSARSNLLGSIAYCEAYALRTQPGYV